MAISTEDHFYPTIGLDRVEEIIPISPEIRIEFQIQLPQSNKISLRYFRHFISEASRVNSWWLNTGQSQSSELTGLDMTKIGHGMILYWPSWTWSENWTRTDLYIGWVVRGQRIVLARLVTDWFVYWLGWTWQEKRTWYDFNTANKYIIIITLGV